MAVAGLVVLPLVLAACGGSSGGGSTGGGSSSSCQGQDRRHPPGRGLLAALGEQRPP